MSELPREERPQPPPLPAWAKQLTHALDDLIPIPGMKRGVGLDALFGLLPGGGDAISAMASVSLLLLALRRGVPAPVLARMIANLGVDALVGSFPVLGDLFDVAFRANRRNLELVEKHQRGGAKPGFAEYALIGGGLFVVALGVAIPIALAFYIGSRLRG